MSAGIEASRCAQIPSPPAEPPVLVLWLNQVTWQFCGEPLQTSCVDSGREPLPRTGSCPRLCLAFLATMLPALDPAGHRSGPSSRAYLSLHSSEAPKGKDLLCPLFTCTNANQTVTCTCNTHPRVSPHHVVNHSSQQGVIIHRFSDAPVLNLPLDECIDNTHIVTNSKKREKEKKRMKNSNKWSKAKQKPKQDHLRQKSRSPKTRATTRHNRDKMLQNCRLLKVWQKGLDTISKRAQLKFRRKRSPKGMNASSP
jgi:hypothetical protein